MRSRWPAARTTALPRAPSSQRSRWARCTGEPGIRGWARARPRPRRGAAAQHGGPSAPDLPPTRRRPRPRRVHFGRASGEDPDSNRVHRDSPRPRGGISSHHGPMSAFPGRPTSSAPREERHAARQLLVAHAGSDSTPPYDRVRRRIAAERGKGRPSGRPFRAGYSATNVRL